MKRISQLTVINSTAAGNDVSDKEMMVAYPIGSGQLEVRFFGCLTSDLHAIAKTLSKFSITSGAMESTGVYWIPLFLLLQEYGFEVYHVNAKHVKNVTGRKDDESDAEWVQKLHSCGLFTASFQSRQPDANTQKHCTSQKEFGGYLFFVYKPNAKGIRINEHQITYNHW